MITPQQAVKSELYFIKSGITGVALKQKKIWLAHITGNMLAIKYRGHCNLLKIGDILVVFDVLKE